MEIQSSDLFKLIYVHVSISSLPIWTIDRNYNHIQIFNQTLKSRTYVISWILRAQQKLSINHLYYYYYILNNHISLISQTYPNILFKFWAYQITHVKSYVINSVKRALKHIKIHRTHTKFLQKGINKTNHEFFYQTKTVRKDTSSYLGRVIIE